MGLTYDGITYRSLEEQVRYDAEQIQLLKQADVTINENLQNVNTEIDGKLTKPANPSAESAVTMLADGTVGTKPLSELGGGGKLYRHDIKFSTGSNMFYTSVYLPYITSLVTKYGKFTNIGSVEEYNRIFPTNYYCTSVDSSNNGFGQGTLTFNLVSGGETNWNTYSMNIVGCTVRQNTCYIVEIPFEVFVVKFVEDTVTEL